MYRAEIINTGGSSFQVKCKDYEFFVDTQGKGVTPPDALLAALGSCVGVYVRKYAEGAKLQIPKFSVTVEADFSPEPPLCFRQIKVRLDLKGAGLQERRRTALAEFIKNCPVHNTLKVSPQVEIEVT